VEMKEILGTSESEPESDCNI